VGFEMLENMSTNQEGRFDLPLHNNMMEIGSVEIFASLKRKEVYPKHRLGLFKNFDL
jgi:hypothetical protein